MHQWEAIPTQTGGGTRIIATAPAAARHRRQTINRCTDAFRQQGTRLPGESLSRASDIERLRAPVAELSITGAGPTAAPHVPGSGWLDKRAYSRRRISNCAARALINGMVFVAGSGCGHHSHCRVRRPSQIDGLAEGPGSSRNPPCLTARRLARHRSLTPFARARLDEHGFPAA